MKTRSHFLKQLAQTLQKNLAKPDFNGEALAKILGMSRMHLHRHLKRYLGVSATGAIRKARLERAKYLLAHTNNTIQKVALLSGYQDPAYFSRVFRKETGFAPSKFRYAIQEE